MDESHTDKPETIITFCFLNAIKQLSKKDFQQVVERTKELLSWYKNMFTRRSYQEVLEEIESLS